MTLSRGWRRFFAGLGLAFLCSAAARPCTIAVISGRIARDGRPILWKNRDVTNQDNLLRYGSGGRYPFIGIGETGVLDKIWAGLNGAGLAIVNAVSTDLEGVNETENGIFIKRILEDCATIRDVELLLLATNGRRRTLANFGVIDARGGGAIFETGNTRFAKFDVEDSPLGFIVRTNFALTGVKPEEGEGFIRFDRATAILTAAAEAKSIDPRFVFDRAARDLVNEAVDPYPLPYRGSQSGHPSGYIHTNYSINRYRTASASVIHGVGPGEDPLLSTFWCILGEPVCGIALPAWVRAQAVPIALGWGSQTSPLRDLVEFQEGRCYTDPSSDRYLDTTKLVEPGGRGILSAVVQIESVIFRSAAAVLERWRSSPPSAGEAKAFQERLASWAYRRYFASI